MRQIRKRVEKLVRLKRELRQVHKLSKMENGDEPAHQILSYTLLFLHFHYFLHVADPPLCTPTDATTYICVHSHSHMTLAFASLDWPHLFDGQMFYDSHALFPFLVAQCAPSCGPTNH